MPSKVTSEAKKLDDGTIKVRLWFNGVVDPANGWTVETAQELGSALGSMVMAEWREKADTDEERAARAAVAAWAEGRK